MSLLYWILILVLVYIIAFKDEFDDESLEKPGIFLVGVFVVTTVISLIGA